MHRTQSQGKDGFPVEGSPAQEAGKSAEAHREGTAIFVGTNSIYERNTDAKKEKKKKESPPFSVDFEDGLEDSQRSFLLKRDLTPVHIG